MQGTDAGGMQGTDAGASVVVVGGGGHARCLLEALEAQGIYTIAGVLDGHKPAGTPIAGEHKVIGDWSAASIAAITAEGVTHAIVAIGDNATRERVAAELAAAWPEIRFAVVVHPSATVSPSAQLGDGTVVFPGAVVHVGARVGRHCIVNTRASLDHDGVMGDFAALAPGSTLSGNVFVGRGAWVGAGAVVTHGKTIGEHTVVGAGAVVVCDLPPLVVAFGSPAKLVRARTADEKFL
jgi:sugar O-acyltransferase (sialic acid O-acetyltransferase NeuD family)